MTTPKEEKEPTDLFALAESRTRTVLAAIRRWAALRKDGKHPYTPEQVKAMIESIDRDWARAKQEFEGGAFSLPPKTPPPQGAMF